MADRKLRILVVGAGAIGGVSAAFMALKGYDVSVVTRTEDDAGTVNSEGLNISGVRGEFTVKVKAYGSLDAVPFTPDYLFHATKATDLSESLKDVQKICGPETMVVSMQNGICEDEFIRVLGAERVIGCVTGWGSSYRGAGKYLITSRGEFVVGAFHTAAASHLEPVKDMLSSVVPAYISENIRGALYSKLIINSAISSLGLISGLGLGTMLKKIQYRRIFIAIMEEAMKVADAEGIRVEPYAGRLDYYNFLDNSGLFKAFIRHATIRIIGFKYRRLRSSSLQSIKRGRKSEIRWLNGYICELAEKRGIPVPVNSSIVKIVEDIENRTLEPSHKNIHRILEIMK